MFTCADAFRRHYKWFLAVSVFVGIFSAVYEHYGHGIPSNAMIFAFLYPLCIGFLPTVALAYVDATGKVAYRSGIRFGVNAFYSGIATLTFGSIAAGVVEIYGTTNYLIKYYTIVGLPLLTVGMLIAAVCLVRGINASEREQWPDDSESDVIVEE